MLALALLACADDQPSTSSWETLPPPTPELALASWDGPTTELCDPTRIQIEYVPVAEAMRRCGGTDLTLACFQAGLPVSTAIVSDDSLVPVSHLVAHELTHWLFFCSDRLDMEQLNSFPHDHPAFAQTVEAMRLALQLGEVDQ